MARGYGVSHVWRKMMTVKDEVEHNIWWQVKAGNSSFWFDNWTQQGALYYVDGENAIEKELKVQELIRGGEWDIQGLRSKLSEEMTTHVVENTKPPTDSQRNDTPWWMGSTQGNFTMKSAYELLRRRNENKEEYRRI
ncbi:hypothetical protein KY284_029009 [Solanum tuberosum]|nr:hypothetical protein KY284_029009 [Solanum tuberosum]